MYYLVTLFISSLVVVLLMLRLLLSYQLLAIHADIDDSVSSGQGSGLNVP